MVKFGSQTTKFCCLILNHPRLPLRLLYMNMIMQLRSGHVTLLRTKFQPLNCPPNQTYGAGRPHVEFCPIFLVCDIFNYLVSYHPPPLVHTFCQRHYASVIRLQLTHGRWCCGRVRRGGNPFRNFSTVRNCLYQRIFFPKSTKFQDKNHLLGRGVFLAKLNFRAPVVIIIFSVRKAQLSVGNFLLYAEK